MEVKGVSNLNQPARSPPPVLQTGHEHTRLLEGRCMADDKYADYVKAILAECPDADEGEISEAFAKYEKEFYIPPQDAMRLSLIHI